VYKEERGTANEIGAPASGMAANRQVLTPRTTISTRYLDYSVLPRRFSFRSELGLAQGKVINSCSQRRPRCWTNPITAISEWSFSPHPCPLPEGGQATPD